MVLKLYGNPQGTGWIGWIETTKGKTIAFVRLNGEVVFDW